MMAFLDTATNLYLLITCCLYVGYLAQQNSGNTSPSTPAKEPDVIKVERKGVEEEVLGPLRVWHIVFLVGLIIVIAVTVFCCCVEWRIPRTRQEIEETYRRRQLNQKYLHQLERTPDAILRNNNNNNNNNNNSTSIQGQSEDSDHADTMWGARRHHLPQNQQQQRTSQHNQDQRQHRHHHHHHHQHQQQQQHADKATTSSGGARGVAMTEASARLARIAKSQMNGVQTPFELTAISALQKQRQAQRQLQRQQT